MVQISEETKLEVGGFVGVALLTQKVRIGGHDAAQGSFVHRGWKGRVCKKLSHNVFSFGLMFLGEDIRDYAEFTRSERLILQGKRKAARRSPGLGIVPKRMNAVPFLNAGLKFC